jgi:D-alanine-D-alanine ligase
VIILYLLICANLCIKDERFVILSKLRIALTFNLKKDREDKPADYFSEFDSEKTILAIASVLKENGHQVSLVEAAGNLFSFFKENEVDFVFNIAEGTNGGSRESQVPAILDFLGIPYTGSSGLTLALALDKAMAKKIFRYESIPTPNFQLFVRGDEELNPSLKFPLIVKPNHEGSAKGILASNVVWENGRLYEEVRKIHSRYNQEVLVEEFIEGRELTVGIFGNGNPQVLPILEIDFSNCKESGEYFYSWRVKEFQGDEALHLNPTFHCPAKLDNELTQRVQDVALKAHKALGCLDISRTDIRLDPKEGIPYVLEVNPLPGLDPDESNFTFIAKCAGISFKDLINTILENAIRRYQDESIGEMSPVRNTKFSRKSKISNGVSPERRKLNCQLKSSLVQAKA